MEEAAICTCGAERKEVRRILEQVRTANVTLESAQGTTLWTRDSVCFPELQADEFPLRLLVHPETRDQTHLPDVLHIEATGLGSRDLGSRRGGICLCAVTQKANMCMARASPMLKTLLLRAMALAEQPRNMSQLPLPLAQVLARAGEALTSFDFPWITFFGTWKASRGLSLCG